jgi:hypothetical protein
VRPDGDESPVVFPSLPVVLSTPRQSRSKTQDAHFKAVAEEHTGAKVELRIAAISEYGMNGEVDAVKVAHNLHLDVEVVTEVGSKLLFPVPVDAEAEV